RIGWDGWVSYDVNSRQSAPIDTMSATIAVVKAAEQLLERFDRDQLASLIAEGNPAASFTHLFQSLVRCGQEG
ncbi:MAG: hypothetical protein GXY79_07435, partial [Chloroflexi bacterium]|nr:hypothetical protein [Chloroflexota bacterium]